jgi:hypothetical protein
VVRWFLERELRERRQYLNAVAREAQARDARRDNDGYATARELALATVHVHFGASFESWIFKSIFWNSLWGSLPGALLLVAPFGIAIVLRFSGREEIVTIG